MKLFLLCFAQIVLYTLGVLTACGLAVEICYRLCFLLMGRRAGRVFWFVTSWLGTPLHELGHALMCVLFAHRIETIRLLPTKAGNAMVEHSYNKKNPYAVFGNLWIALGPVFSGLAVMVAVLYLVYPVSMQTYGTALGTLLESEAQMEEILPMIGQFIRGLVTEQTRAIWVRILALIVLFSVALHVRVSTADVRGMLIGLPSYLILAAMSALVITLMGEATVFTVAVSLQRFAWALVLLFSLILLFALATLLLVIVYRLLSALMMLIRGEPRPERVDFSRYKDYRDRDWEDFKK